MCRVCVEECLEELRGAEVTAVVAVLLHHAARYMTVRALPEY